MKLPRVPGETIRFLFVGVINTVIGFSLFAFMLAVIGPPIAGLSDSTASWLAALGRDYYVVVQWVAWVVAVPISTMTMKRFAFRNTAALLPQIARAYLVYLPAQGISALVLWIAVRVMGFVPLAGQLMAIAVTTVFSYIGHKYFTFRIPLEVGEVPPQDMIGE